MRPDTAASSASRNGTRARVSASVASRSMHLRGCGAGALTPFGDLHNHQAPRAPLLPDLGAPLGFG